MVRKARTILLTVIFILFIIARGDTLYAESYSGVPTTTGYRYSDEYMSVYEKYSDFKKIKTKGYFAIPGLVSTNICKKNKTDETTEIVYESCDTMVPQGICVAKDYILITAYDGIEDYKDDLSTFKLCGSNKSREQDEAHHDKHNSVIYVLNKITREYIATLVLPDKNHVGGIAFDGNYVWIAKSKDNKLSAISYESISLAVKKDCDSTFIKYEGEADCGCIASFVTYYDEMLWVGEYHDNEKSRLLGFNLKISTGDGNSKKFTLNQVNELSLPKCANGATFAKINGETCLAVNSSHGRLFDTKTYLYSMELDSDSKVNIFKGYGKMILPPMAEEICVDGTDIYTLFESGSTPYSTVDGFKCGNIVDRVVVAGVADWFYWTKAGYQDTDDITIEEPSNPDYTYEISSSEDAKYVPTYVKTGTFSLATLYNPYSASMAYDMALSTYSIGEDTEWSDALSDYGYCQIQMIENGNSYLLGTKKDSISLDTIKVFSSVNATLGIKKVIYNGQIKYSIAIAFRGTGDAWDWLTDVTFEKNSAGLHSGFVSCANAFYDMGKEINFTIDGQHVTLYEILQDMKSEDSKYCMVITGHSLGGAVADVYVGRNLCREGIFMGNVVAYTFAPAGNCDLSYSYNENNIFNIINADDMVPLVGNADHIGTDIQFLPDDEYRANNYGDAYEPGQTSSWWSNPVNFAKKGFVAHYLEYGYANAIKRIGDNISAYCSYNTTSDNLWDASIIIINRNCFGKIGGDLITTGSVYFQKAQLEVGGNCSLCLNRGNLSMSNSEDYLLINGNFFIENTESSDLRSGSALTAGTVEVKGDFKAEIKSNGIGVYYSKGSHKTILSGNGTQHVSSGNTTDCSFANLSIKNPKVIFDNKVNSIGLCSDAEVTNIKAVTLNNNGYDINVSETFEVDYLYLTGDSEITKTVNCGRLDVSGQHKIKGDLNMTESLWFAKGQLEVEGDYSVCLNRGTLYMSNDEDYLLVNGNFDIVNKVSSDLRSSSDLRAGTVEVKGDFKAERKSNGIGAYYSKGSHKTILSGNGTQHVSSAYASDCCFATLVIENDSSEGVVFNTPIHVSNLFNHNRKKYTLYNNGSGSYFPDYDGDGINDNEDKYPLRKCVLIEECIIAPIEKQQYTGEEIKPAVEVRTKDDELLIIDEDYSVSYINNIKIGTASIKIDGIDNSIGTITIEFEIYCEHDFEVDFLAATCLEDGYSNKECKICGEINNETLPANGHSFTNYVYNNDATCTENGTKVAKCDNCDETDTIEAENTAGHSFTNYVYNNDATCTENGTKIAKCDNCDETDTIEAEDTAGHSFTSYVYNNDATCTKHGTETAKCDNCDVTDTRDTDITGNHRFSNYVYNNDATCIENGTKTAKCDYCDETDTIEAKNTAAHDYQEETVTPATLTKAGKIEKKCKSCSDVVLVSTISKIDTITLTTSSYTYDGKAKTPKVAVKDSSGKSLLINTDYTVSYINNINAGTGKVTIKGIGKYAYTKELNFTISKATYQVTANSYTGTYDGSKHYITLSGIKSGSTVKYRTSSTGAWSSTKPYRSNVGKSTVYYKITNKNYADITGYKTITLNPKGTSIKSIASLTKGIKVTWTKQSTQTSGYEIQYSDSGKFSSPKTVTISKNTTVSTSISKLTAKKKYYVRIRTYKSVNGTRFYSKWSSVKSVKTK